MSKAKIKTPVRGVVATKAPSSMKATAGGYVYNNDPAIEGKKKTQSPDAPDEVLYDNSVMKYAK